MSSSFYNSVVMCQNLPTIDSGMVTVTSDNITTIASLECVQGYTLVGESNLTCESSGSWSAELPRCGKDIKSDTINLVTRVPMRLCICLFGLGTLLKLSQYSLSFHSSLWATIFTRSKYIQHLRGWSTRICHMWHWVHARWHAWFLMWHKRWRLDHPEQHVSKL